MITVHHLNNSRSQRVLWLLEELELPYNIERYQRDPKTLLAPAALRAVHPLGKSPVVSDGARVLAESGAIIEYLIEQYGNGRLVPEHGSDARLRYRYFLHYAEGSLMPLLLLKLVFDKLASGPMPFFVRPIAKKLASGAEQAFIGPQLALQLGFVESELAKQRWFAGDSLTGADIQMSYPLEAASQRASITPESHPGIARFLTAVRERPAFQRAQRKVGDFLIAGA